MTPVIHIVRATVSDAELITDLSHTTFIETYRGTCSDEDLASFLDNCFSETGISKELTDPDEYYFVAFADGMPAGYTRLKEDYTDYPISTEYKAIELKRIYVLNEYQGHGIGAALLHSAFQLASTRKFQALWLGVWEHNRKAIAFYQRFGLTETGKTHTFYIGETAQTDHWMIKVL